MSTGAFRNADATVSAHGATALAESDSTVFPVCRALYVGVSGNLVVTMADDEINTNPITFLSVPIGIFPIQIKQLLTATTATDIVALY